MPTFETATSEPNRGVVRTLGMPLGPFTGTRDPRPSFDASVSGLRAAAAR